ncbi:uncharacterized protein PGTG_12230 [Puccinia graminis f. sp. tritici CRL 75-36-700-3]|uniref:Uncharacterized protein n=1 Tax=Puccinia graminis f. sp. tritici (strain CRL 75-36-700-3 / race SCCL) TaxID=418459 RepID=E3KPN9_PUCGT|nr:uncharacterized protein PGTG_12230 [Puccinia graminis f. sp. tritici CRL 75-36-700-3]EFP86274.2 hypothetical protein PGTG_12230 [Puccinia graminis f. sp. tritici CRL 75-36-700-3]
MEIFMCQVSLAVFFNFTTHTLARGTCTHQLDLQGQHTHTPHQETNQRNRRRKRKGKNALFAQVKQASEKFQSVWLFTVDHVWTPYLQDIRSSWKPSQIYMGRNAVMRLGLRSKEEDERKPGLGTTGKLLEGDTGLLLMNIPV